MFSKYLGLLLACFWLWLLTKAWLRLKKRQTNPYLWARYTFLWVFMSSSCLPETRPYTSYPTILTLRRVHYHYFRDVLNNNKTTLAIVLRTMYCTNIDYLQAQDDNVCNDTISIRSSQLWSVWSALRRHDGVITQYVERGNRAYMQ